MSEITVKLTRPIKAHGDEISTITIREPSGGDIMDCGYPLALEGQRALPQAEPIGRLIAKLGGIPPSSVRQLCMPDYNACMGVVLGFFGGTEEMPKG